MQKQILVGRLDGADELTQEGDRVNKEFFPTT